MLRLGVNGILSGYVYYICNSKLTHQDLPVWVPFWSKWPNKKWPSEVNSRSKHNKWCQHIYGFGMSSDTLFSGLQTSRKMGFLFFSSFLFYSSLDMLASFGRLALFIWLPPVSSTGAPWPLCWSICLSAPLFRQVNFCNRLEHPFFTNGAPFFFHKCRLSSAPFFLKFCFYPSFHPLRVEWPCLILASQ